MIELYRDSANVSIMIELDKLDKRITDVERKLELIKE